MDAMTWLKSEKAIISSKKQYAHFDRKTDLSHQWAYVSNPEKIRTHSFYPFIHYQINSVKFSKQKGKRQKSRDICYAAHIDRCIYQYYSFMLNNIYNERVQNDGISSVAVAYRTNLHESNIEFSKYAFDFIKENDPCYIMIGDFTGFFDNLDHRYLKKQLCSLLHAAALPSDYYAVFKSITAYSKWELADILELNGYENSRKGRKTLNNKDRVLSKVQYDQYRSHITKNTDGFGIPQGSPISAVLANIYMLETDKAVNECVLAAGGKYMRYSDDFIVIIPDSSEAYSKETLEKVISIIEQTPRLQLEPNKTQYFRYADNILSNCSSAFHAKADASNRNINFLGFSFDGYGVRVRAKTISKYYYRMNRKAKTIAKSKGYTPTGKHISCKNLYKRYSERGANESPGNFLTYINHASKTYGTKEGIDRDTKKHMQKIRRAINGK